MIIPCQDCGTLNRITMEESGKNPVCGKCKKPLPEPPATAVVNDLTFDPVIQGTEKPVLVDFWAKWCAPCRMLGPVLGKFASSHPHIQVLKVDTDQSPALSSRFQISMVPTLMLFVSGKEMKRVSGSFSLGEMEENFREWL